MSIATLGSRAWINGVLLDVNAASIPISDRGFTLGDGLFETMYWTGSKIRFFDDHMARLATSADELGFAIPMGFEEIEAGLIGLGADAQGAAGALRLTLSRGGGPRGLALPVTTAPQLIATIGALMAPTQSADLATVTTTRHAGAPSARFKTLSYIDNIMALDQARKAGAQDAIMWGTTGNVACASSANIIIRLNGRSLTPAHDDGALPGIIRGRLLKAGLTEEACVTPLQLAQCDAAVLTNALIGVRPVAVIDGRQIPIDTDWARFMLAALDL